MSMSESSTIVTEGLFAYIAGHTIPEDDFLRALKQGASEAGFAPIWIAHEQGSFIHILLRLMKAREVVEIGTLAGYSAIWIARALPGDGMVRTIEVSGKAADFAERWVARSDVAAKIKIYRGAAKDILPKIKSGSADAVFIDADKANYLLYLDHALRLARPGGLILADNAFAFGRLLQQGTSEKEVEAMRAFNERMTHEPAMRSVIVPLGDGLWIAVKVSTE
jgi:caffeoyl-CoA O-methyltransferase